MVNEKTQLRQSYRVLGLRGSPSLNLYTTTAQDALGSSQFPQPSAYSSKNTNWASGITTLAYSHKREKNTEMPQENIQKGEYRLTKELSHSQRQGKIILEQGTLTNHTSPHKGGSVL